MAVALILAVSCKVVERYEPNPMTDSNISRLSYNIFQENAEVCLHSFYNAYHIGRFLQADAEEMVSQKYDIIRTGLVSSDGHYIFDYDDYYFAAEGMLKVGKFCTVDIDYYTTISITMISEEEWQINNNDGMSLIVKMLEENEEFMKMEVTINGTKTESSLFRAVISDEGLEVKLEHEKPGALESLSCDGKVIVEYYEENRLIKTCLMTFRPGLTTSFDVF